MKTMLAIFAVLGFFTMSIYTESLALDLNQANVAELDSINGVGPAKSRQIVAARDLGSFLSWDDFMQRVKGVKPKTAASFSAQGVTINDQPYTPSDESKASSTPINAKPLSPEQIKSAAGN